MKKQVDFSVVIPLLNEEEVIPTLLGELALVCGQTNKNYEIILVDDGSTDKTFELLEKFAEKNDRLKIIRLSRNFGHQAAFSAGINMTLGEKIITMDGDLQYPPAMIPAFLEKANEGFDIVIGERLANKQNSFIREIAGRVFYKLLTLVTNLKFRSACDFALYNRRIVDILRRLPERERFLRGLVQWVGFRKTYIPYSIDKRKYGEPKYTLKKLFGLALSGVTSFSAFPLRLAFWIGLLVLAGSIIFSIFVIWNHYTDPNPLIAGWATLVILVLFLGSIQLVVIGIVGEYLYKMFNEIKGRPTYIISETKNLTDENIKDSPFGLY